MINYTYDKLKNHYVLDIVFVRNFTGNLSLKIHVRIRHSPRSFLSQNSNNDDIISLIYIYDFKRSLKQTIHRAKRN